MAGSVTITDQKFLDRSSRPVRKLTLAWTCDASGVVSGTLTDYVSGEIVRAVFAPGSPAPTDLYDATLLDGAGADVLGGQGADRSAAVVQQVAPGVPLKDGTSTSVRGVQVDDTLELRIANAGNSKAGTLVLYVR